MAKIETQFLRYKQKWTAYTTYRGYDMYELDDTEVGAIIKLLNRL